MMEFAESNLTDKEALEHFPLLGELVEAIRTADKLEMINRMPVKYYDTDSTEEGIIIYIATVEDNERNRDIIKQLGYTNAEIDMFHSYRDNEIDLACFIWDHVDWFDGEKFGVE